MKTALAAVFYVSRVEANNAISSSFISAGIDSNKGVDKGQGGLRDTRADDDFKQATLMGFDLKSKSLFAFH